MAQAEKLKKVTEKEKLVEKVCRTCKWYQDGACELTRVVRGGAPLHSKTKACVASVVPSVLGVKEDFGCNQWEAADNANS